MAQPFLYFEIGARAQVEADDGTRALAEPMRDILAGDNQILSLIILAAKHDVRVGMAGIAVVSSDPFEPGAEILFHLLHQPAHKRFEVGILIAILGGDDEPELVTIAAATLDERCAIGHVSVSGVKAAWSAIRGGAVALKITQVRAACGDALRAELDQPRFDHDTTGPRTEMTITTAEHATNARAASTPAAIEPA